MIEYYERELAGVIDGKILGLVTDADSDEGYWGLRVLGKDGKQRILWVLCDPEGNGPGHLDLQEV